MLFPQNIPTCCFQELPWLSWPLSHVNSKESDSRCNHVKVWRKRVQNKMPFSRKFAFKNTFRLVTQSSMAESEPTFPSPPFRQGRTAPMGSNTSTANPSSEASEKSTFKSFWQGVFSPKKQNVSSTLKVVLLTGKQALMDRKDPGLKWDKYSWRYIATGEQSEQGNFSLLCSALLNYGYTSPVPWHWVMFAAGWLCTLGRSISDITITTRSITVMAEWMLSSAFS